MARTAVSRLAFLVSCFAVQPLMAQEAPDHISFKQNRKYEFAVVDSVRGKLERVGTVKYDASEDYLLFYALINTSADTLRHIRGPYYFNDFLFEVKHKSPAFIEFYTDSLRKRSLKVLAGKNLVYYTPHSLFGTHTYFVYAVKNKGRIYSAPDPASQSYTDSVRFRCFYVMEVKDTWIRVKTNKNDPCGNYERGSINEGWIKWFEDGKIVVAIEEKWF